MDFLKSIMSNPTMIRVATDKLRSLFTDDGIKAIVLRLNPHNLQPPLPGFDVHMFKEDVSTIPEVQYGHLMDAIKDHPYAITAEENIQFSVLKNVIKRQVDEYIKLGYSVNQALDVFVGDVSLVCTKEEVSSLLDIVNPQNPSDNADSTEL